MAQHLLNGAQIRAIFQKVDGKRVAKCMGGNVFFNTRFLLIVLDDLPKALTAHTFAVHIHEKRRLLTVGNELMADIAHIIVQGLDGCLIQRNDALLAPAGTADKSGG